MEIQSVVFDAAKWTARDARGWLLAHQFKAPKVDHTKSELRYRQRPPAHFVKESFRRIDLEADKGIFATAACPKPGKESDKQRQSNTPKREDRAKRIFRHLYAAEEAARDSRIALEKWTQGKRFDPQIDNAYAAAADARVNSTVAIAKIDRVYEEMKAGKYPNPAAKRSKKPKKTAPARKSKPKRTTTTTTTTQKTTVVKNPIQIPKVISILGDAVELEIERPVSKNGIQSIKFRQKASSKGPRSILAVSSCGRYFFIFPRKFKKRSRAHFDRLLEQRAKQVKQAAEIYETFSEFEADRGGVLSIPEGIKWKPYGWVSSISYASDKWSGRRVEYIHKVIAPANLWVDSERAPKLFQMVGDLHVTDRGIEG